MEKEDVIYNNILNLKALFGYLKRFKENPTASIHEEEGAWEKVEKTFESLNLEDFGNSSQFNRSMWSEYKNELHLLGFEYSNRKETYMPEFESAIKAKHEELLKEFSDMVQL